MGASEPLDLNSLMYMLSEEGLTFRHYQIFAETKIDGIFCTIGEASLDKERKILYLWRTKYQE